MEKGGEGGEGGKEGREGGEKEGGEEERNEGRERRENCKCDIQYYFSHTNTQTSTTMATMHILHFPQSNSLKAQQRCRVYLVWCGGPCGRQSGLATC